jgi:hypothetical protein
MKKAFFCILIFFTFSANAQIWTTLGPQGFTSGEAGSTSIRIDTGGTPYLAYSDFANDQKATVMKFVGNTWVPVGTLGFSAGETEQTSLAIGTNNTPYVVYRDLVNGGKATVMKFVYGLGYGRKCRFLHWLCAIHFNSNRP